MNVSAWCQFWNAIAARHHLSPAQSTWLGGKSSCRISLHLFLHIHLPLPCQKPRPHVLATSTLAKKLSHKFIAVLRRLNCPEYLTRRANFQRAKVTVGVQIENAYLGYVAHWFEKRKSFIWCDVAKWWLKCFIFAPIQRTDWTPQCHPVTACRDFLKLVGKMKHFLPFLIASHSASPSHLRYLSSWLSVELFELCVLN